MSDDVVTFHRGPLWHLVDFGGPKWMLCPREQGDACWLCDEAAAGPVVTMTSVDRDAGVITFRTEDPAAFPSPAKPSR